LTPTAGVEVFSTTFGTQFIDVKTDNPVRLLIITEPAVQAGEHVIRRSILTSKKSNLLVLYFTIVNKLIELLRCLLVNNTKREHLQALLAELLQERMTMTTTMMMMVTMMSTVVTECR
jgi:hypothetical protein